MKRMLFGVIFFISFLFVFPSVTKPVNAAVTCSQEDGTCCNLSTHTCSNYSSGWSCGSYVCCWTSCNLKPTPTPTPIVYTCETRGGYCSPDPCGDDSCGSGDCGGWYCCKACSSTPILTPTLTPVPTPTCGGLGQSCCGGTTCTAVASYCHNFGTTAVPNKKCVTNCAHNIDCAAIAGYDCPVGTVVTENLTYCTKSCTDPNIRDNCTFNSYNCPVIPDYSCGTDTCHPTWCRNISGILDCVTATNPSGNANYDDCVDVTDPWPYVCGWCPGTGPAPTGTPLPTPPGATPTPMPTLAPGTIQARAMRVDKTDTSCAAVRASVTGITGTVHQFSPSSASQPAPQTQSGSTYSVFTGVIPGSYTIASQAPAGYVFARACWDRSTAPTTGETLTASLLPSDTLTWDLGYTLGTAWSQVTGGDVYAAASLTSSVPALAAPRAFILDGATGGFPGVATYGADYTFDSSGLTRGQTWVSSKNWLVNDTSPNTNFYQLLYTQFGGAPDSIDYVNPISPVARPDPRAAPYYVTGNMTTSGNWTVAADENLVFFVDGNLTVSGTITIAPGGFVAFIARGNITIDPVVASVDGIYITSPAGTFDTGTGAVRLTGTGMFIAGNFTLGRDLGDALNPTTASELFVYDPQLLVTMPEAMKKMAISWQEVAP